MSTLPTPAQAAMGASVLDLMSYNADVELEFTDGSLSCSSHILGLHSSVLRTALECSGNSTSASTPPPPSDGSNSPEATTTGSSKKRSRSTTTTTTTTIPMPGTTTEEWLQVAAFMYPLMPPPAIADFQQLETCLKVASQFDIKVVLHKVDQHLSHNAKQLEADTQSERSFWKWLLLADKCGLQDSLAYLAARAASVDLSGCENASNFSELSPAALKLLVKGCARQASDNAWQCTHCDQNIYGVRPEEYM